MINTIQSWILFFLAVGLPFVLSASALNAAPILTPILQQEEEEDETETEEDEERKMKSAKMKSAKMKSVR